MAEAKMIESRSRAYQWTVTVIGMSLWIIAAASQCVGHSAAVREQWTLFALVPVVILVGMFPITFPLPSGLTSSKINGACLEQKSVLLHKVAGHSTLQRI